jgi:ACS family glucarate transporter-like MFS transporter
MSRTLAPADSAPPVPRPTSVRWHLVGLMMAYSFMSWFNRTTISVAGTERIMSEYGISPTAMGVVYSALIFAYALCMTPGGLFIDRKGPWAALVLMGFGSALFVALTGAVGFVFFTAGLVWLALVIVRALLGVCNAPIYPACGRIISRWLPLPQRAWANGLVNGAAPVGIASTFFLFGGLIDLFNWPTAFLITAALTAALALAWFLYARDYPSQHARVNAAELHLLRDTEPPPRARPHAWEWLHLFRNRSLVFLTLSYAAVGYFEYLFFFWTEYYFKDVLHLPQGRSRLYSTILTLSMGLGMMLGGWVSDRLLRTWGYRWGRAAVPMAGLLTSAVLLGAGLLVQREPLALVACFALALAAGGSCEGACWATAIELGGRRGGTSAGIFNTGGNLGGLSAPVVTPWVSLKFGWNWGIALGGLACLLAVALWLGIDPRERLPET